MILIKNIDIYNHNNFTKNTDILIKGNKIISIQPNIMDHRAEVINGKKHYAIPGFIDLQVNGGYGSDILDDTNESVLNLIKNLPREGTTSFVYTYITLPIDRVLQSMNFFDSFFKTHNPLDYGSNLLGFHLEGPFIDKKASGVHDPKFIIPYNRNIFEKLLTGLKGRLRIVTFTPTNKTLEFVELLIENKIMPSIGHTTADFNDVISNYEHGALYCTHLFNRMTGIHHRDKLVAHTLLQQKNNTVMFICDFVHLSPEIIELILKYKDFNHIILVTDASAAKGEPDGVYKLANMNVKKIGSRVHFAGHPEILAGSASTMHISYKNILSFKEISIFDAIKATSYNAAKALQIDNETAIIHEGKIADILIMNKNNDIEFTICNGVIRYKKDL